MAGNGWLLFALLLTVGSGDAGSFGPDTYRSFFGSGKVPTVLYVVVVIGVFGLAARYFYLYGRTRVHSAEPGTKAGRAPEE